MRSRHDNREGFYHTDGLGSTRAITDNVGLVTDRYTYDAFGGLLDQTGTFGNSFGFAGEQRDSATGLDYLRARYYDPSLGRFISKDAFPGYLDDPMSQHDYQYAHANPVSNTDPSGYFSMGDMMATLNTMSSLAAIGGVSFGTGYIAGAAAGGASGEEIRGMFGEWGAGFASGVSGGFLTDVYEYSTGNKIEPNHAMLYNAGNVTGISVSFITGMKAATWVTTGMGPLKWVAAVNTGLDGYGAGKATYNLNQSYQDNGKFEVEDAWNLLAYVPFAGVVLGGIKGFLGANRALQNADALTKAGNCFVAGTEVLTVDGIKNIEDIQVGDWVIADDPTTPGEIEAKQVLETFVRETDALVDLYVDGEVISTTGEHPFWVPDKGWVEAKDLEVGSLLQTEDGRIIDVDKIEKREGKFPVYNFKVEGIPTYFVSELGILVHNANYDLPELELGEFKGTFFATVPNDPSAVINIVTPEPGVVVVPTIYRGNLPPGSGGQFLGEALKGLNISPSKQLKFQGIANEEVAGVFNAGGDPANSSLGKAGRKALEYLGLTPKNFRFEKVGDDLNLIIDVN